MSDAKVTAYDIYIREREQLIRAEHESAREFSKVVVALSTAALGFSILFVEKIAASPPSLMWALWAAWFFFGVTCLSTLLSLHTSARAFRCAQDNLRVSYGAHTRDETEPTQTNASADHTRVLGVVSIPLFVIALVFLLLFAGANLKTKKAVPHKKTTQHFQRGTLDVL